MSFGVGRCVWDGVGQEDFYAVGQFFEALSQVTDEQAIAILQESCAQAAASVEQSGSV